MKQTVDSNFFWAFQSTLPRGERQSYDLIPFKDHRFQSTLPRGERRRQLIEKVTIERISIHAPTRGATTNHAFSSGSYLFQSTLPRGERHQHPETLLKKWLFQSTLPRGERQQFSPKSSLFSQQKLSKIFNLNNKLF